MAQRGVYIKEAFIRPGNLVFLGLAVFFSAIAAGFGAWSVLLWPVIAEGAYLLGRSRSASFRRRVHREKGFGGGLFDAAERDRLAAELGAEERVRFQRFLNAFRDIVESSESADHSALALVEESLRKIEGMRDGYLRLLHARRQSGQLLQRTDEASLRGEIESRTRETQSAAGEAGDIRRKSIELLRERLEHLEQVRRELGVTDAQLEMMEATIALLRDKAATLAGPTEIESQADLAVRNMNDAETIAGRMESLLMRAAGHEQGIRE